MTNYQLICHLYAPVERARQRGDSLPTKFVSNKTRAKQRRTKEPAKMQVLEQGSGEPRVLPSPLVRISNQLQYLVSVVALWSKRECYTD